MFRSLFWLGLASFAGSYLVFSLISYGWPGITSIRGFELMGSARMPSFDDLKWLLSFSACDGNLQELLSKDIPCFGYRNPAYPTLSMELGRWLGWGPKDAGWIGVMCGAGITAVLAHACWLCRANTRSWAIIVAFLGLSFPYQLLLERGNIDSVIFCLIALFCLLVWLPGVASIALANGVAAMAIALKIYPAILTVAWWITSFQAPMERQRKRILNLTLLGTTAAALLFTSTTLHGPLAPAWGGLGSHGLSAIGYANVFLLERFGKIWGRISIYGLFALKAGSSIGGLCGGLLLGRNLSLPGDAQRKPTNLLATRYVFTLAIISSAVGLGCYISSICYDYRWVFLFPLLGLILSHLPDGSTMTPANKRFFYVLMGASAYVLLLPFANSLITSKGAFLELIDEMILAPFLFSGLGGVWVNLLQSLPEKLAPSQSVFPIQPVTGRS